MQLRIALSAERDVERGFHFYERQNVGVGDYFLDAMSVEIQSLTYYAGVHAIGAGGAFRLPTKRFPFAIYYRVLGDVITIAAVLDCRRSPRWIKKQLQSRKNLGDP